MASLLPDIAVRRCRSDDVDRLVVALSGGMDSLSLLHAVHALALPKPLIALHVNHGLQTDAAAFARHCRTACEALSVPLEEMAVEVSPSGSLEARAREARYAAFEAWLQPGDLLMVAHHADDQVETALFRLFRGSGVAGLDGMPVERDIGPARLYRPLLSLPRRVIEDYAREQALDWIEDSTNAALTQDRNYLRHAVLPLIEQRWPGARAVITAGIERDRQARARLAAADAALLQSHLASADSLPLAACRTLPGAQLRALLLAWFIAEGRHLPSTAQLAEVARCIREQHRVNLVGPDFELRQQADVLYLLGRLADPVEATFALTPGEQDIGPGVLACHQQMGAGLLPGDYVVGFRRGGDRLRMGRNRTFKNLCQEQGVPAWLRDRLPLIRRGAEVVAMPGLPAWQVPMLVADGWRSEPGGEGLDIQLLTRDRSRHVEGARLVQPV